MSAAPTTLRFALEDTVTLFRESYRRLPAILDWTTSNIAAAFPELIVIRARPGEQPADGAPFDLVAIDSVEFLPRAKATGVAGAIVVTQRGNDFIARADWSVAPTSPVPSFSLIVTTFNAAHMTLGCLESIHSTLPDWFKGEIIVIDDASREEEWKPIEAFCESSSPFRLLRNETNLGYLRSCNRAASEAAGEILVLLNNDTQLLSGWLEAIRSTFELFPDAGAVGGKLLYPDGRLQEAGAILYVDGSGWNIGRGDDPDAPLYNFTRDTDYCSGAFLATPRAVWDRIGGYDLSLAPIYYEDAAYCFAVRKLGLRVIYQPEASMIHIEGGTSGTDLNHSLKRHQLVNRTKFVSKWREELANRESPPLNLDDLALFRAVFDPAKPRLLMISSDLPEDDKEGGSKGMFDCADALREEGWNVVWAVPDSRSELRYAQQLEQLGVPVYTNFAADAGGVFPRELERLVIAGAFDVIMIHFWHVAHEWAPTLRRLAPRSRIVIHTIDLHFLRESRRVLRVAHGDGEPLLDAEWSLETRLELNAYARADRVIAVSDKEARLVDDFTGKPGHASVVPLMEEVERSAAPFSQRRGILFLGSFRHPPNLESAKYLFEEIVPRLSEQILEEHPITVIGTALDERVRELARGLRNVNLVGWVPSVYPWFERARVSVVPLLHGAGTKNKVVQACMIGTPSVCTSVAIEGLDLRAGRDVIVADDPDSFAAAVQFLLADEAVWNDLAASARAVMEASHSRQVFRERLIAALQFA